MAICCPSQLTWPHTTVRRTCVRVVVHKSTVMCHGATSINVFRLLYKCVGVSTRNCTAKVDWLIDWLIDKRVNVCGHLLWRNLHEADSRSAMLSNIPTCQGTNQFSTFHVSRIRKRHEMYIGHARLCACLCVCPSSRAHITARTRM